MRLGQAECPDDSLLLSPANETFRLRANSFGTDSELSLEEVDSVPEIANLSGNHEAFRQIDYLWLFNPYLNFSKRQSMALDESALTIKDYSDMREINRVVLTQFLIDFAETNIQDAAAKFSEISEVNEAQID